MFVSLSAYRVPVEGFTNSLSVNQWFALAAWMGILMALPRAIRTLLGAVRVVKGFPWWLLSPATNSKTPECSILETEPSVHLHPRWAHIAPVCMPSDVRVPA